RISKNGRDHKETLKTMANLAYSYRDTGRMPEAVALMEEVLDRERTLPVPLPKVDSLRSQAINFYEYAGLFVKSEPLYREFVDEAREESDADDRRIANALAALGANLLHQGKYAEAEKELRECLTLREKAQPLAWSTWSSKSMLGE